jgi:hypothetical protein
MLYLSERCQNLRPVGRPSPRHGLGDRTGSGGAYRDRTDDPLLAKQVLSQLS